MFVSLNKKIVYSIAFFFILTALLFIYSFYIIYGIRFQDEIKSNIVKNQQYLELLYENNSLQKDVRKISEQHPEIKLSEQTTEIISHFNKEANDLQNVISREKKHIEELSKTYDNRYASLQEGIKIVGASSVLIILSMALLWFLMRRWILSPLGELSDVSHQVSIGNIKSRVHINTQRIFLDEIDYLSQNFNSMLQNLEDGIKEIKDKETFLQSLIDSLPDGLRVIDEDYNVIISNKEYLRQIGKPSRLQKCPKCYKSSQNFSSPCPDGLFTCPVRDLKAPEQVISFIQQFATDPNRHLSINAAELKVKEKGKRLIVEVIRDLSEDIKFSHQQKLSSLGFIATSVAHEIKNNLGSIRMITESLLSKIKSNKTLRKEEIKLLELVHNQIVESVDVPERLLKLSHYSDDSSQIINCSEIINDIVAILDYEATRNGIKISLEATTKPLYIKGNEADFKMMTMNLIINAINATPNKGAISIKLSSDAQNVIASFSDTGKGIAKDKLGRIFDPFFSEGEKLSQGTGLGLPIVKSIVGKLNGTIDVKSKINSGTCFTIKIPKAKQKI